MQAMTLDLSPTLKVLKARSEALVKRLGIVPDTVVADGDVGYVEHVIHELSHAKVLKLDLECDGGLSHEIERRISRARREDIQVATERRAWSVEWVVLQTLPGMIGQFEWGDVVDGASVQGVDNEGLRLMNLQTETWWARKYAREIVAMLSA